jgi:BirA family biotin operon repressor/biotin-[acetyl-CoA-carboxylase] ligase
MDYSNIPIKFVYLDTVDSTNNYVAKMVHDGTIDHGTVVLADYQVQGRGQRGTNWQSLSGENVTATLFLRWKSMRAEEQFRISMLIAIGVCKFLRNFNIEAEIKWPNDILVNNKKIGGILIENQMKQSLVSSSIIGIGFNVNQTYFPKEITAVSLTQLTGKREDTRLITLQLFQEIGQTIHQYIDYPFSWLERTYCSFLKGFNQAVLVRENATLEETMLTITGVCTNGLLQTLDAHNNERLLDLKEVTFFFA